MFSRGHLGVPKDLSLFRSIEGFQWISWDFFHCRCPQSHCFPVKNDAFWIILVSLHLKKSSFGDEETASCPPPRVTSRVPKTSPEKQPVVSPHFWRSPIFLVVSKHLPDLEVSKDSKVQNHPVVFPSFSGEVGHVFPSNTSIFLRPCGPRLIFFANPKVKTNSDPVAPQVLFHDRRHRNWCTRRAANGT